MEKLFDYILEAETRHKLMNRLAAFVVVSGIIVTGITLTATFLR